jgi:GT2 family glycosyltransferase
MGKTLLGIVSYGNLNFLNLSLCEALASAKKPLDIAVVVAKPGDIEMVEWLKNYPVQIIVNTFNKGFAGSLNDLGDRAFVESDYDNLIIMGNDVIPYPNAIDAMIECADTADFEWIYASQFDVKALVSRYPEARHYFAGDGLHFTDFKARPWDLHSPSVPGLKQQVYRIPKGDIRDLCLFKRSVFDKIGYADPNFWPNGYWEDNDYCRRAVLAEIKGCLLTHAAYFHFWSRTIHEGEKRAHDIFFRQNQSYYETKWGGLLGNERYTVPFDGDDATPADGLIVTPSLKIGSRTNESLVAAFWQNYAATSTGVLS